MNWIKKHITLLGIVLYMLITLGFVSTKMEHVLCENVEVNIIDSTHSAFIEPQDVVNLLKTMEVKIWGYPNYEISSYTVESVLHENMPMIDQSRAWADIYGTFHIDIVQRKPIARIVTKTDRSYYIGKNGYLLPLSPNYSTRVPVVSGDIYQKISSNNPVNIDTLVLNVGADNMILDEVFKLVTYINNDSLLKRQIEQIHITGNEFELIPMVGTHTIAFGTIDQMEDKFFKLKVIYYKGFSNLGWNKYSRINLKYKNQVVCTKR